MAAKKDDFSVKNISRKLGGERGIRNPNGPSSSHDLVEQMEFLYVEVIKVINKSIVNPIADPIVEITLGNYKSSTTTLPPGPKGEWNQVFAFDKTKGDVLSVTLKQNGTVTGKQNFKLAADIPFRVPPDARIAPQWYSMAHMELMMLIWYGTQADEVYPRAWFSDSSDVSASCVVNTRPKLYLAPRLCYVRVTIVSGHDLISNDLKRTPSVYVRATLGDIELYTEVSIGSNPSWNQDLIFVASEPLEDTVYITLFDRVNDQHHDDQCIGILRKKLSEMTAVKTPGSVPALFYDLEPPVMVETAGDSRRFASRIKMKLATDQAYHVLDECIQYSSDYRAFAKGLWSDLLGKLEIGILGATGLQPMKEWRDGRRSTDAYVVAKYGNKWARTRTVVGSFSPKWNEQYSWDVYDKCTTVTFGIFDNNQLVLSSNMNDNLIGKVRIQLTLLEWDRVYICSCPILVLREDGLKKMGELQLAIRCLCVAKPYVRVTSPFRWMLPKAHYKSPMSLIQTEDLRTQVIRLNCLNLARTEPPLRNEVVLDMLRPTNKNFSMRITKANLERLRRVVKMFDWCVWMNETIRSTTDFRPKIIACVASFVVVFGWYWLLCLAVWPVIPVYLTVIAFREMFRFSRGEFNRLVLGVDSPPPLIPIDLMNLRGLDSPDLDEIAEELDTCPSSVVDVDVLRMRYDRLRKEMGEKVMLLLGDVASQCERFCALLSLLDTPLVWICFLLVCYVIVVFVYVFWDHVVFFQKFVFICLVVRWVNFQCFRNDLPSGISNFFRRLPTKEGPMFRMFE